MTNTQLLLLCFSVSIVLTSSQPPKLVNIGYLSYGYDIYNGNPNPTSGFDPGFRGLPIFDFQYTTQAVTNDGRFMIPDSVQAIGEQLCNLDFTTSTITGTTSYKNSLEVSVEVTAGYGPASFSASTDYKSVSQGTTKDSSIYTTNSGKCSVYTTALDSEDLPPVHSTFIKEVVSLPATYDDQTKQAYMSFLARRGTHYFTGMRMGAKYGYQSKITTSAWTKMTSMGIKVSAAASYSAMVKVGIKEMTDSQKEQASTFDSSKTDWNIISVGSTPPVNGDVVAWAQTCYSNPMPIRYTLNSIESLFDSEFLPNIANVAQLKTNIRSALADYCPHLQSLGKLVSCQGPDPDRPLPMIPNSCRLCAGGCGSSFTVDSGAMSMDQHWPNFFMTYDNTCSGALQHNNYNNGVHLCCQPESDTNEGECKLCSSCGGSYNLNTGSLMCDQNWPNWILAYDNSCYGDLRNRGNPGNGIQMCCKTNDICSLCSSCGGDFPQETGVLSYDQHWPNFFNIKGGACSGGVVHNSYSGGVSLCCKSKGI